jgi:hypothetical protein
MKSIQKNKIKKTRQFTMWVSDIELKKLKELAKENNTTMSQYIRDLLFYTFINQ